jgi:hypothetical protein
MKVLETIERAQACCALVPERDISEQTRKSYKKEFRRMWSRNLDPLEEGIARDTYNFRRAALHTGGKLVLQALIAQCMAAGERQDAAAAKVKAAALLRAVERIEDAFKLEPPLPLNAVPWQQPASRWQQSAGSKPRRGANSKRHCLKFLPDDWDERLWAAAEDEWEYREPLAVELIAPLRLEALVPGKRPTGWSSGVTVELRSPRRLAIAFAPGKSHRGLYGTELTTIIVDPTILGGAAAFLARRCEASDDNRIHVRIGSKDAVRKAIARLGHKALPEIGTIKITPNVLRHQIIADLKLTLGAGEAVAAASGHCTDRTQAKYGFIQHGRKRKGYVSITAARPPRCENVERARQLSRAKGLRPKK